jgi:hypothetical protein
MADALAMPAKRPPETERERRERIELIGRQIEEAIKLDGEATLKARTQGLDQSWYQAPKP